MQKLPVSRLPELFARIDGMKSLYLPVSAGGRLQFGRWTTGTAYDPSRMNTVKSAKDFFFPQSEDLVFFRSKGKELSITEAKDPAEPFVLFGVRACDAKGLEALDRVFLSDPVDTFYAARRENGVVVTMACAEPEETCFCGAFGVDAAEPGGDVAAWLAQDTLYWQSRTDKGDALTAALEDILEDADQRDQGAFAAHKAAIKAILDDLPLNGLSLEGFGGDALEALFGSDKWPALSQACIGCGTCTFVCPTCQCYDIQDFDTGRGVKRFRCWDSCMYSDFTLMAHGNPRTSQVERFRQRFMHKLVYFPANNEGMYGCVGCGRCVAKCPAFMNIVKVIRTLGVNAHAR